MCVQKGSGQRCTSFPTCILHWIASPSAAPGPCLEGRPIPQSRDAFPPLPNEEKRIASDSQPCELHKGIYRAAGYGCAGCAGCAVKQCPGAWDRKPTYTCPTGRFGLGTERQPMYARAEAARGSIDRSQARPGQARDRFRACWALEGREPSVQGLH
jgi:hypothetical protein